MVDDLQREPLETSLTAHIAALVFCMLLPTVATLLYFVVLSGSPWMKIVYFGSKVVQFSFPVVWVLAIQRRRIRLAPPDSRSVIVGLLLGLAIVAVALIAYFGFLKSSTFLGNASELIAEKVTDMGLTSPTIYIAFALFLAVLHSFMEEYYWRWFVYGQLQRVTRQQFAMILSSLAFMSHHVIVIHQFMNNWPATVLFSLCVAIGGYLWAWLYWRYRSLYGP